MSTPLFQFRRVRDRILNPVLSFPELRHAFYMLVFALIPSLSMFVVFEVYLRKSVIAQMCRNGRNAPTSHDLAPLFNYYTVWVAHMMVSIGVGAGAARGAFRNTSVIKKTVLKRSRILVFLILMLIVLAADAMHSNL